MKLCVSEYLSQYKYTTFGNLNCVKILRCKFADFDNSLSTFCHAHSFSFNIAFYALAYVSAFTLHRFKCVFFAVELR